MAAPDAGRERRPAGARPWRARVGWRGGTTRRALALWAAVLLAVGCLSAAATGAPGTAEGVAGADPGEPAGWAVESPAFPWAQAALFACAARPQGGAAGVVACAVEAASWVWVDARLAEGGGPGAALQPVRPTATGRRPTWLDRLFLLATHSGGPPALAVGLAGLAAVDGPAALEAATAAAGALAITGVGKLAGGRVRPDAGVAGGLAGVGQEGGGADGKPGGGSGAGAGAFLYTGPVGALAGGDARMSMPSGHASGAWAVASVLARRYPGAAWAAYLWASAVSLSRVYLGRHWPSDVGTGAHVGRWWGGGP